MYNLRMALSAGRYDFRKWAANPRIYVIVLLMLLYFHLKASPYAAYAAAAGEPVGPWLFPLLTGQTFIRMMLLCGIILLFCDAPFIDETQPYVIERCGRRRWITGQILYIIAASFVYFLAVLVVINLFLLPRLTFTSDWGKVLYTLSQGGSSEFKIAVSNYIVSTYLPLGALIWGFLLAWLVGVFLGMLILALNMYFKRWAGLLAATFLVFIPNIIQFFGDRDKITLYYLCPATWFSLDSLDATGTTKNPPVLFAVGALVIMSVLLAIISVHAMRKKEIDVLPPV